MRRLLAGPLFSHACIRAYPRSIVECGMKRIFTLALIVAPLLSACFGYKPFQPNPYEYERWSRLGDDELAVRKAMLECGYPSPNGVRDRMVSVTTTPDEIVMMYRCMTNSGYLYDGKPYNVCQGGYSSLSACDRGASVPRRDVTRRLNGRFCHVFPLADVCKL